MSIHNRETNKNGRSFGGVSFIYIPISPSTSFIIVVVTTTIPESSTSRQQPPIPDQSRACFSDSTPTGSYFRFRVFAVFAFSHFLPFSRFRVFRFFAWPAPASPGAETHVSYAQKHFLRGALFHPQITPELGRKGAPPQTYVFYFYFPFPPPTVWLRCQLQTMKLILMLPHHCLLHAKSLPSLP